MSVLSLSIDSTDLGVRWGDWTATVQLPPDLLGPDVDELQWYLDEALAWEGGQRTRARAVEGALPDLGDTLWRIVRSGLPDGSKVADIDSVQLLGDAGFPWELMGDEDGCLAKLAVPVIRGVARPPSPAGSLRVLVSLSRPSGASPLASFTTLRDMGLQQFAHPHLTVSFAISGTWTELCQSLAQARREGRPFDVLHVDAHGMPGILLFEDAAAGGPEPISVEQLVQTAATEGVRLVYLDACNSAGPLGEDRLMPLAEAASADLIAFAGRLHVDASHVARVAFYAALRTGQAPAQATASARQTLYRQSLREQCAGGRQLQRMDGFALRFYAGNPRGVRLAAMPEDHREIGRVPPIVGTPDGAELVGRDRELLCALRALGPGQGLVLAGMSGDGKTSLASRVAHSSIFTRQHPHGVLWLDLATIEGSLLTAFVERALAASLVPADITLEDLPQKLVDRRMLLVLDHADWTPVGPWDVDRREEVWLLADLVRLAGGSVLLVLSDLGGVPPGWPCELLGPLSAPAARRLAYAYRAETSDAPNWMLPDAAFLERQERALQVALARGAGHPPTLECLAILDADSALVEEGTMRGLEERLAQLDSDEQRALVRLSLMGPTVHPMVGRICLHLDEVGWVALARRLVSVGLARPLGNDGVLTVHPLLLEAGTALYPLPQELQAVCCELVDLFHEASRRTANAEALRTHVTPTLTWSLPALLLEATVVDDQALASTAARLLEAAQPVVEAFGDPWLASKLDQLLDLSPKPPSIQRRLREALRCGAPYRGHTDVISKLESLAREAEGQPELVLECFRATYQMLSEHDMDTAALECIDGVGEELPQLIPPGRNRMRWRATLSADRAEILRGVHRLDEALDAIDLAVGLWEGVGDPDRAWELGLSRAQVLRALGRTEEALLEAEDYLDRAEDAAERGGLGAGWLCVANAYSDLEKRVEAAEAYQQALGIFGQDLREGRVCALLGLSHCFPQSPAQSLEPLAIAWKEAWDLRDLRTLDLVHGRLTRLLRLDQISEDESREDYELLDQAEDLLFDARLRRHHQAVIALRQGSRWTMPTP